jgi:sugar transferase (PEP-CTERM system associated)
MTSVFIALVGADLLLAVLALLGVHGLIVVFAAHIDDLPMLDPSQLAIFGIVLVFAKYFASLYGYRHGVIVEIKEAFLRLIAATMVSFLIIFVLESVALELSPYPLIIGLSLGIFCLIQLFLFYRFPLLYNLSGYCQNTLILGAGPMAESVASVMARDDNLYKFCGFVHQEDGLLSVHNGSESIAFELLHEMVQENDIKRIVVVLKERRENLPVRDLFSCKLRGVEIIDAVTFYENVTGKLLLENIHPGWFVFNKGFIVNRVMFIKQRIADLFASVIGIILSLPLFPLIALAIKLESKGPVLYRQARVGFKEELFQVIKFRTMREDAEQGTGAMWAQVDDDRITRVGAFLRKTRLDELPQLFNILKGDMSFVGPRPERPEFVEHLNKKIPFYSRRHAVKPGLTGWAQVMYPYGASDEDALEKLRYDLYFIKNFSLYLEVLKILKTVKVVLFGKGGR